MCLPFPLSSLIITPSNLLELFMSWFNKSPKVVPPAPECDHIFFVTDQPSYGQQCCLCDQFNSAEAVIPDYKAPTNVIAEFTNGVGDLVEIRKLSPGQYRVCVNGTSMHGQCTTDEAFQAIAGYANSQHPEACRNDHQS